MIDLDLGYPLSLGLVAAFNPCGFAMLPAYTSYFVGLESEDESNVARNVLRALVVGLTMTLGFVAVFGLVGLLTATLVSESSLARNAPYLTFAFGLLMIPLGIAMLRGYEPKLNIKRLQAGGGSATLPSIFLFGVSYAIASISCTIALFLLAVTDSFGSDGIIEGTASLLAYALGMGLVIMVLTLSLALARTSVATNMRRILPYVNRMSGATLIVAGGYLTLYALWEIQLLTGDGRAWGWLDENANTSERVRSRVNDWIANVGETRLALAIGVVIVGVLTIVLTSGLRKSDRWALRGAFVFAWMLIEVARYDFDLLILPLVRTVGDIPERIGHWFSSPFRWPVFWELLAAAIFAGMAWLSSRRRLDQASADPMKPDGKQPMPTRTG
jgi:cytochrome c-type biogenesis protein